MASSRAAKKPPSVHWEWEYNGCGPLQTSLMICADVSHSLIPSRSPPPVLLLLQRRQCRRDRRSLQSHRSALQSAILQKSGVVSTPPAPCSLHTFPRYYVRSPSKSSARLLRLICRLLSLESAPQPFAGFAAQPPRFLPTTSKAG